MMAAGALADTAPVKMEVPPEAIETQAEGELETYDLTFPEDMPLAARNFVLLCARRNLKRTTGRACPSATNIPSGITTTSAKSAGARSSRFTARTTAVCSLFAIKQDVDVQPGDCISAMEGRVGNVRLAFEEHGRWLDGTEGAVPKPGYLVIYGVRSSTPYTHVAIVESVRDLGGGLYELTTIEGNLNSTVRRINYRYNANPKRKYYNMSVVPENEITQENCQYTLQKDDWYVTGFCATW